MKKLLSLVLILGFILGLSVPAFAFEVKRSTQTLSVDGAVIDCDKYNIDGNNYFKLRDLAYVLNGTGSQFDVGYNAEKKLISITTNHAYTEPNDTELVVGEDLSLTAKISPQTIMIDGAVRNDLTAYNIGGSNYFKLRELGDALGFDVGYDTATRTMRVESRSGSAPSGTSKYLVSKITETDLSGSIIAITTISYDENGNEIKRQSKDAQGDYTLEHAYTYDAKGNCTSHSILITFSESTSIQKYTYDYNEKGQIIQMDYYYEDSPFVENGITNYYYDEAGNCVKETEEMEEERDYYGGIMKGSTITYMSYNLEGHILTRSEKTTRTWQSDDDVYEFGYLTVYSYDSKGQLIREEKRKLDGSLYSSRVFSYDIVESEEVDNKDRFLSIFSPSKKSELTNNRLRYYGCKDDETLKKLLLTALFSFFWGTYIDIPLG